MFRCFMLLHHIVVRILDFGGSANHTACFYRHFAYLKINVYLINDTSSFPCEFFYEVVVSREISVVF